MSGWWKQKNAPAKSVPISARFGLERFVHETTIVTTVLLLASLVLLFPSFLWSKAPEADILQFLGYPWAADRTLARPQNLFSNDGITLFYVFLSYARETVRNGQVPLWNPYIYAGAPFLGNPLTAVFYPYSIFVYLLPLNVGIAALYLANLMTAGLGTYLLLRRPLDLTPTASLFGSLSWMLSGSIVGFLHYSNSNVWAWMPLVLYLVDVLVSKGGRAWAVYLGFAFAACILGGNPEVTFIVGIFAAAYCILLVLVRFKSNRSKGFLFKRIELFAVACSIALGLAAVDALPAYEYAELSYRKFIFETAPAGTSFALSTILKTHNIAALFYPNLFISPLFNYVYKYNDWIANTYAAYCGIIALAIVPIGVRFGKWTARKAFFVGALLFSLAYSFGEPIKLTPLYLLPVLNYVLAPRFLSIFCFCTVVLSAISLDAIMSGKITGEKISRYVLAVLFCFIAGTAALIVFLLGNEGLRHLVDTSPSAIYPLEVFPSLGFGNYLKLIIVEFVLSLSVLTTAFIVLGRLVKLRKGRSVILLRGALILLVLSNLFFYALPYNSQADQSLAYPRSGLTDFITSTVGNYRIAQLSHELPLNAPMQYRVQSVEGYDTLMPIMYGQLTSGSLDLNAQKSPTIAWLTGYESPLFNLLGVKYFVTDPDASLPEGYNNVIGGASSLACSQVVAELHTGISVGQTFIATYQNLTRISVLLATAGRAFPPNSGFTFILLRHGVNGPIVYRGQLDNWEVKHDAWFNFTFSPLNDSQGKKFSFWLTSNSTTGFGLFPWYYPTNTNPGTQTILNGTTKLGSLVYKTYYKVGGTNLSLVYSGADGRVYLNNLVYPRAFMVYRTMFVNDSAAAIRMLNDPSFDSRSILILDHKEGIPTNLDVNGASSVLVSEYSPGMVSLKVHTSTTGFLLLTDQYYPGWQALVNGHETGIYRADLMLRAVLLPAGNFDVNFVYNPTLFVVGAVLTLVCMSASLVLLSGNYVTKHIRAKRKRTGKRASQESEITGDAEHCQEVTASF
jgi:hypothetical protein